VFSNTSGSLGVVDPAFFPAYYDWSSGATLLGYYYGDPTLATLPPGTRAAGADVMAIEFYQGATPQPVDVVATLADASTIYVPITTLVYPGHAFIGFTSDQDIVSVSFATPDASALGSYPLPILDDVVYTTCADPDGDGVCDPDDDCPTIPNPTQADSNQNGVGDACEPVCVSLRRDPGVSPTICQDAYLAYDPTDPTRANTSYGSAKDLYTGPYLLATRRGLIQFDVSSIPPTAIVSSATLVVRKSNSPGLGLIDLHLVTAPWSEATVTWSSLAGAFDPTVISTMDTSLAPNGGYLSADLTAAVALWVSGAAPNHGVLLDEPSAARARLGSCDAPSLATKPHLDICYVPGG
jgi:hypothetical protein